MAVVICSFRAALYWSNCAGSTLILAIRYIGSFGLDCLMLNASVAAIRTAKTVIIMDLFIGFDGLKFGILIVLVYCFGCVSGGCCCRSSSGLRYWQKQIY